MPPVFAHGRLRLYLLKLLDEAPRHGYEVIRLLEERFQGLYAPSAGTVYPRLAKLEAESLVSHTSEGGRKVYSITAEGRAELADRQGELAALEQEIHESLTALAADIREDVRDSADELRREMLQAAERSHETGGDSGADSGSGSGADSASGSAERARQQAPWGDQEAWRRAKEELRQAKQEWQKQARRARSDSRKAREKTREAEAAAEQARRKAQREAQRDAQQAAQEEVGRIARNVQEQVQQRAESGDWQGAVREGMAELAKEMGSLGRLTGSAATWPPFGRSEWDWSEWTGSDGSEWTGADGAKETATDETEGAKQQVATDQHAGTSAQPDSAEQELPDWATDPAQPSANPARELERLLDRFRDDVRDAARDNGVTEEQLRDIRRHLSTAAAHIGVGLRPRGD